METKRKKTLFNVIMVVLILIIAGCGIMAVGNLKGWFGKDENSVLVSQNVKGVANIQRSGVGYRTFFLRMQVFYEKGMDWKKMYRCGMGISWKPRTEQRQIFRREKRISSH